MKINKLQIQFYINLKDNNYYKNYKIVIYKIFLEELNNFKILNNHNNIKN